jgi:hypothetical protein
VGVGAKCFEGVCVLALRCDDVSRTGLKECGEYDGLACIRILEDIDIFQRQW